jgi:hypothetical protein
MRGIDSILVCALLLVANFSCSQGASKTNDINRSPSPQLTPVIDIKGQWETEYKKLNPAHLGKEYPGRRLDILVRLLRQAPKEQVQSELERVRKEPMPYEQMSDYDKYLLQALFGIYAGAADREMLVYLLSAKCPRFVATSPVEAEVASIKTAAPFLILFESYDRATAGERKFLLGVLREPLFDISEKYRDDTEFISAARSWYQQNLSRIKVNPYYHPAGRGEQRDLFVPID